MVSCGACVVHFYIALSLTSNKKKRGLLKYITRKSFVHSVLVYIFSTLYGTHYKHLRYILGIIYLSN